MNLVELFSSAKLFSVAQVLDLSEQYYNEIHTIIAKHHTWFIAHTIDSWLSILHLSLKLPVELCSNV